VRTSGDVQTSGELVEDGTWSIWTPSLCQAHTNQELAPLFYYLHPTTPAPTKSRDLILGETAPGRLYFGEQNQKEGKG
jgi:hypothetical protein